MSMSMPTPTPTPTPKKLAVQFGLNYENSSAELGGCINDVDRETQRLETHLGYERAHMTILTDHTPVKPTLRNMTAALIQLAKRTHEWESVEEVWIGYSGHGTFVQDVSGDEKDRRDECLVPLDYETAGLLHDDALQSVLALIHKRVRVIVKVDACHSGTAMDLRYRYVSGDKTVVENPQCRIEAAVYMISGCRDNQTSADAYDLHDAQQYSGAMTSALWHTLEECGYVCNYWALQKGMRRYMRDHDFAQVPQICSTRPIQRRDLFCCSRPTAAALYLGE
jgi:hypothetical protein